MQSKSTQSIKYLNSLLGTMKLRYNCLLAAFPHPLRYQRIEQRSCAKIRENIGINGKPLLDCGFYHVELLRSILPSFGTNRFYMRNLEIRARGTRNINSFGYGRKEFSSF